ncbi:MAG: hypothetical protein ACRDBH_00545 [Bosea sp. (in: a-proteobacteria)]
MAIAFKRPRAVATPVTAQASANALADKLDPLMVAEPPATAELLALQHEVARYVAQMSAELGGMARSARLDLLAYFLDMARVEASIQIERTDT